MAGPVRRQWHSLRTNQHHQTSLRGTTGMTCTASFEVLLVCRRGNVSNVVFLNLHWSPGFISLKVQYKKLVQEFDHPTVGKIKMPGKLKRFVKVAISVESKHSVVYFSVLLCAMLLLWSTVPCRAVPLRAWVPCPFRSVPCCAVLCCVVPCRALPCYTVLCCALLWWYHVMWCDVMSCDVMSYYVMLC